MEEFDPVKNYLEMQRQMDWMAKSDPQASPPIAFMRAGKYLPTGKLSSQPSFNIENRMQPYSERNVPQLDPSMFLSVLARALGTPDIGKKK